MTHPPPNHLHEHLERSNASPVCLKTCMVGPWLQEHVAKIIYQNFHFPVEFHTRGNFMIHLMNIKFGWSRVRIVTVREVVDKGRFKDARTSGQQKTLC